MFHQALADPNQGSLEKMALAAATYKKGVSLLLALRRPSYYLANIDALNEKTNIYLRLLTKAGIVSPARRGLASSLPVRIFRLFAPHLQAYVMPHALEAKAEEPLEPKS